MRLQQREGENNHCEISPENSEIAEAYTAREGLYQNLDLLGEMLQSPLAFLSHLRRDKLRDTCKGHNPGIQVY